MSWFTDLTQRTAAEREVRLLRADLDALRQRELMSTKQHDDALRQEREKTKELKDDLR